jgi:peptidoglycan/xylan/chitin deacetylase (PgdA/CDA1 family)
VSFRLGRYIDARAERRSPRQAGVALVYHSVGDPAGDPRHELVPAVSTRLFRAQLKYLSTAYRIVPPSRLLDAVRERRPGDRFPLAITFDDDLRSHVDVVAPALRRARLPAAFFVCGATLGPTNGFWWEDLQAVFDREDLLPLKLRSLPELDLSPARRPSPYAIHHAAEVIENLPPARRDAVARELRLQAPDPRKALGAPDLRTLADAAFEIGFHTRRHYLLTTLDDAALTSAIIDGRSEVEEVVGQQIKMLAYPHGKSDNRVAGAARSAGYELAFSGYPISVSSTTDPLMIGRVEGVALPLRDFARHIATTLRGS